MFGDLFQKINIKEIFLVFFGGVQGGGLTNERPRTEYVIIAPSEPIL